jgi:hypothetical protein
MGTIFNRQNDFFLFDPEDGGSSSSKSMVPAYHTAQHGTCLPHCAAWYLLTALRSMVPAYRTAQHGTCLPHCAAWYLPTALRSITFQITVILIFMMVGARNPIIHSSGQPEHIAEEKYFIYLNVR